MRWTQNTTRNVLVALALLAPGVALADDELVAAALDAVTTVGEPVQLRAKLSRTGRFQRDAKGEVVTFGALGATLFARTDASGFAGTSVRPEQAGVTQFRVTLQRDTAVTATGRLFTLDAKRPVVFVDLEDTLGDLPEPRFGSLGDRADSFPGAADLLQDLARSKQIVYLTSRDSRLDRPTRAFLARHRFPDAPVVYADVASLVSSSSYLDARDPAKLRRAQVDALAARGVSPALAIGGEETVLAYEGAKVKDYVRANTDREGASFRFNDFVELRRRLEADGALPPSPKDIGEGTWKYSVAVDGVRREGLLEATLRDAGFDIAATEAGTGDAWTGRGTITGGVFTVRRTLTTGVVGSLSGQRRSGVLEYEATLNRSENGEVSPVSVFALLNGARTHVGSGTLSRPSYFSQRRREVDRAIRGGDMAVLALPEEALAAATANEKVAMIKALLAGVNGAGREEREERGLRDAKQKAVVKILASAQDAIAFDRVFYRLDKADVLRALAGRDDDAVRAMIAKHEATARPGDWADYVKYLDGVTGSASSGLNKVDFLVDGEAVTPVVLAEIEKAKESIHLSIYEWQADELGFKFARKLADKAKAGVNVRVLLDQNGTSVEKNWKDLVAFLRANKVEVVVNPTGLLKSHLDHRKLLVIDGKVGFTGGMNIGGHYQKDWHDQQTRLEGPVVAKLQDAFLERWTAEAGTPPLPGESLYPPLAEPQDGVETRIVQHLGAGADRNIKAAYVRAIATATSTIRISTPYFADEDVIDALSAAAERGVKVQVILPRENDVKILRSVARAYYPQLLKSGVEVYEYTDRMAHQKVAVIDGLWATAGSSNLDARSLEYNDELNYVIVHPTFAKNIERDLFDKDLQKSERVTEAKGGAKEWLLRGISPWL